MGKRSDFERKEMDFYPTPYSAVKPLLRHLPHGVKYCEPCAGAGDLVGHLHSHAHCTAAYDIKPQTVWIKPLDASFLTVSDLEGADMIITNPPWEREPLHQIINRCAMLAPTWLLFDADWMHTRQSEPFIGMCSKIVSVGRVKWIADSDGAGKDNACWYLFDATHKGETVFYGRVLT
jgi:hypothetical protein